jgi:molybdate transport system permease protein
MIIETNELILTSADIQALWLTFQLACVTTLCLLIIATPLAWWLSQSRSRWRAPIESLVALPIVLPPTVIGFYLLIAFNTNSPIGGAWLALTGKALAFSFEGLVIGSMIYSLPFVAQPLQLAFSKIDANHLHAATLMGANSWVRFTAIIFPLARQGYIGATVLGFAHTIGEFGLVLMIGGSIPGETQVASIRLFELVEGMQYTQAHFIAGILLILSFTALLFAYKTPLKWR